MNLKEKIIIDKEIIETVKERYIIALREYESVKNPIEEQHRNILAKFRTIINAEVKDSHQGCCRPDHYDDAWFTTYGITMRIDANHHNDIYDCKWTWEEVENVLGSFSL